MYPAPSTAGSSGQQWTGIPKLPSDTLPRNKFLRQMPLSQTPRRSHEAGGARIKETEVTLCAEVPSTQSTPGNKTGPGAQIAGSHQHHSLFKVGRMGRTSPLQRRKPIRETSPWPPSPTNLLGAKMKAQASFVSALASHLRSKVRGPFPASLKVLVGKRA